ncbi:MAG: DUF2169 domain-containing protein [Bacteroidetes bacterium]|nr:DUF2169 domain-containing protein [Bacteroidota bacterium]MBS1739937.1 DUF2169 domain-containing protein [Bacteroidota bacterium]
MELINNTAYPHLLFRTAMLDDMMAVAPMLRVTYDVRNGICTPSKEQFWKLDPAPWEGLYGPMESDYVFQRGGIDVMVFGNAVAPNNIPIQRMLVKVAIAGKLSKEIMVIGNRKWKQMVTGLSITNPEPFTEMPIGLANAYGGWAVWDELRFPYSNNPHGKGFIWEKEFADGVPLPNVENPQQLITEWNQKPHPETLGSMPMCEKKVNHSATINYEKKELGSLSNTFFNASLPDMIVKELLPGEEIIVEGMTSKGNFKMVVPDHSFSADIFLGTQTNVRKMQIDQIGVEPNIGRAFITYRYPFNYKVIPGKQRTITLYEKTTAL